jgi:hypothetical protein
VEIKEENGCYSARCEHFVTGGEGLGKSIMAAIEHVYGPREINVPGWQHSGLVLDALLQWWAKQQGGVSLLMHKDGTIEYSGTVYKSLKSLLLAQVPIETVSMSGGREIHVWGPLVEDNNGVWRIAS